MKATHRIPRHVACLALLAAACIAPSADPAARRAALRPTPEDRWREAAAQFEADLEARREVSDLAVSAVRVPFATRRIVTVSAPALGRPTHTVYDVNDLVTARPSFAAPRLGFGLGDEREGEDGETTYHAPIDPDDLTDTIRASIQPESWNEEGNSVEVVNGRLIVRRKLGD